MTLIVVPHYTHRNVQMLQHKVNKAPRKTKLCTKFYSYYRNSNSNKKNIKYKKAVSLVDSVSAPVAVLPLRNKLPTSVAQQR